MSEIRKGFSWASLVCFIALVAIVVYLAWQSTTKEDTQNYTKGAVHNQYTSNVAPTNHAYPLSCSRFIIQPDGSYKDEMAELRKQVKDNRKVDKK